MMDFQAIEAGFHLEGLCPDGDALWFTDVHLPGVRRRAADGKVAVWLPETRMVPSLLLNADDKVLCGGFGGITWLDPASGRSGMLLDAIDGESIPGVNEMIPDGEGGVYFGVFDQPAVDQHRTRNPGGVYRLHTDGQVDVLDGHVGFPNGIGLSPDRRRVYCSDTYSALIAYDIDVGGAFSPAIRVLDKQDCDGLAIDENGNVWVTGFATSEILRVAPDGDILERIATPALGVSNLRFGGVDGRDLFITATSPQAIAEFSSGGPVKTKGSRIYQARSEIAGLPIPKTEFSIA